jgi:NADPH2:quinone reductase
LRAFAIDEFGGAGSVHELDEPTPAAGQVRVKVEAASVNPADLFMMAGAYKDRMEHHFPLIPGADLSGIVDAVGEGVTEFKLGDAVFGVHGKPSVGQGTLAERVAATTGTIAKRPAAIDAAFGAALPLAGVSALQMVEAADLRPGDPVVVIGAGGGIGSFVVQLAAAAGARPIAVTRAANHDYVRGLGAAETIDYSNQDVVTTVRSMHPDGVAAVFDQAGDKDLNAGLGELIREDGHFLSMRGAADADHLAQHGVTGVNVLTQMTTDKLERLAAMVEAGKVKRPEIKAFPLEKAGEAFAEIGTRHVRGKLVVLP